MLSFSILQVGAELGKDHETQVQEIFQRNGRCAFFLVDSEKFPESRKLSNVDNLPTLPVLRMGKIKVKSTNKTDVLKVLLMRFPIIRHISEFIENNDQDFIEETLEVLEHLTDLV